MAINKVIYDGNTLIDLTGDNVVPDKVLVGCKAHGADGEQFDGTCDFDVNSQDATGVEADVVAGRTFYAKGEKRTGSMPDNGAVAGSIAAKNGTYTVPRGYHDGSGKVSIDETEKTKLVPSNIRQGVTLLGVEGAMTEGEASYAVKPYYEAGDTIPITITTAGFLTTDRSSVQFFVPLSKPVLGNPTVSAESDAGFMLRQNGNYTHGTAAATLTYRHPGEYVANLVNGSGVRVFGNSFTDKTNAINNATIGVYWSGYITFS